MATLNEIFNDLQYKALQSNHAVSRVLKLANLKRLVVQVNAVPNGDGTVHFSMTLHSKANYRKQIGIVASDADDLMLIAQFLQKYGGTLSQYIKFTRFPRQGNDEVEIEDNDNNVQQPQPQPQPKPTSQPKVRQNRNAEDEF